MEVVRQMEVRPGMSVEELVSMMDGCGLGAGKLAEAVRIYESMLSGQYTKFFALSGAMVPAGLRNLVSGLIRKGYRCSHNHRGQPGSRPDRVLRLSLPRGSRPG